MVFSHLNVPWQYSVIQSRVGIIRNIYYGNFKIDLPFSVIIFWFFPLIQISILYLKRGHKYGENIYIDPVSERGGIEHLFLILFKNTEIYWIFHISIFNTIPSHIFTIGNGIGRIYKHIQCNWKFPEKKTCLDKIKHWRSKWYHI